MHLDYRPDINGLRGVAVLAVIFYHLNPRYLPGGFAGVDIFFVISGFLITGIIRRELEDGNFSFWEFYARRVRRIYPALILVIVATLSAAYFLMLPPDYSLLGESAKWSAAGLSNFLFLAQAGYFAPEASRLPLLHTWSLGIEEQFYLVWPFVAWLAWRLWAKTPVLATLAVLIAVASFIYAYVVRPVDVDLAFYSPLARAWELALGALVSLVPPLRNRWLGQSAALLGAILVGACLWYARGKGEPIVLGLGCLGAALLIMPKPGTLVGKALAVAPARFVGQISYSLYLWHWPLLILWSHFYLVQDRLPTTLYLPYGALLLLLATLSWLLVERPFRAWRGPSRWTVGAGAFAAGAVVLLGFGVTGTQGLPSRIPEKAARYASYVEGHTIEGPQRTCWSSSNIDPALFEEDKCVTVDPDKPNVLLVGDSHANQFSRAMNVVFPELNISYVGSSGCYPLLNTTGQKRCIDMMARVFEKYVPQKHFDAVILSGRWKQEGSRLAPVPQTIDYIRGFGSEVVILGPNHEYKDDLPTLLAYRVMRGPVVMKGKESNRAARGGEKAMRELTAGLGAHYYSTLEVGCAKSPCMRLTPDDEPMLFDDNHLSDVGAVYVLRALRQQGMLADLISR